MSDDEARENDHDGGDGPDGPAPIPDEVAAAIVERFLGSVFVESHGQPVVHVDRAVFAEVATFLRDEQQFAMMVDYSFLRIGQDDPNALLKAGRHLRHVHLANPSRNPRAYPFDSAESDYAAFFAVLKAIGYRGGLSVHAGSPDPMGQAPKAITFLRQQAFTLADSK